jgi:hypothetical protein
LFSSIGGVDSSDLNMVVFYSEKHLPRLPHQLAFQIQVIMWEKTIFFTIIDEGASTYVISISCWKFFSSPSLNQSPNTLKSFEGRGLKPFGVLNALPIELEGKIVIVEVEVVNAPLNYNLLLGCICIYSMSTMVSTLFHVLHFPHQGKIVTVDQLAYFNSDSHIGNFPFIKQSSYSYKYVGVGVLKYSSLMGTFPLPSPDVSPGVAQINMILTGASISLESYDPWVVSSPTQYETYSDQIPLSLIELDYQAIQSTSVAIFYIDDRKNSILDEYSQST